MSSAERYLNDFLSESEDLKATLTDAANSHLRPSTVDTVVELVLLRSFSVTEQLFREIFYSCMLGDESIPGSGGVVRVSQREHADLLLLATAERESAYVSWLPAKRVLDAAKRYLQPSNPFERIRYRDVELGALQDLTTIRNAVAHPDSDAMERFSRLAAQRGYPHIRPASYLLSKRAGELEIRLIIARLERIARDSRQQPSMKVPRFSKPSEHSLPAVLLRPDCFLAHDAKDDLISRFPETPHLRRVPCTG